jgi:hypothetical protein
MSAALVRPEGVTIAVSSFHGVDATALAFLVVWLLLAALALLETVLRFRQRECGLADVIDYTVVFLCPVYVWIELLGFVPGWRS